MAEPTDEATAALRLNYNTTGVAVMQAMYSDEYLSIGGLASTDELAVAAGVTADQRVLDVGCGVGGPALRLAESVGCRVSGVDLVESSIDIARAAAKRRGLDHLAEFVVADATELPYPDRSFDVVWGQDAWCHVPDKERLVSECARVLAAGGVAAFTDWLAGDGAETEAGERALDAALSRHACTTEQYQQLLDGAGFGDVEVVDLGASFATRYRSIYDRLEQRRKELSETFGERVFDIVATTNRDILEGFETGAIGGARFVARLRS